MSLPDHYYRVQVSTATGASGEAYFEDLRDAADWAQIQQSRGATITATLHGKPVLEYDEGSEEPTSNVQYNDDPEPTPGPYPLEITRVLCEDGEKYVILTNQKNHYATTYDPTAARHIVAGPDLFDALKEAVRAAQEGKRMSKANHETAQTAIDRWEKGTLSDAAAHAKPEPELDLYDQIQAKRVHDCPKCGSETDTDYNNGPRGNEYYECCTECEWTQDLGTVTESLS